MIQTSSGILEGRFAPREAVTILATQTPMATSAALWKLGQARPGQILTFRVVSIEEAIELRRALDRWASADSLEPNLSHNPRPTGG